MLSKKVLEEFGLNVSVEVEPVHQGLINSTWKVTCLQNRYILQKINSAVFKHPQDIDFNISLIAAYLRNHLPQYFFIATLPSTRLHTLVWHGGYAYRLFPFIEKSHSINTVQHKEQAYEAARQFGKFTAALKDMDVSRLKITIPDFHNLSLRYVQFEDAARNGNAARIAEAGPVIDVLKSRNAIVEKFEQIKSSPLFRLRVTHHDTKINNVLFNDANKGICVIDLDTVMPGYFISDVGDMMRTYLCPVSEEEKDLNKIEVRKEIYDAIVSGYLSEMKDELSQAEKEHFFYAGQFMIYMQALRFLTDYLNNDAYYGAAYEGHNLTRAKNQLRLLEKLEAM